MPIKAKRGLEPPKRKFIDLFLDDNDLNEKSNHRIHLILFNDVFRYNRLSHTALVWDIDLKVSETIYTSFVVVTLGAFGISEVRKKHSVNKGKLNGRRRDKKEFVNRFLDELKQGTKRREKNSCRV